MSQWRLTKEVSISDIVAFLVVAGTILMAWQAMNERVVILEASGKEMSSKETKRDQEIRDMKTDFKDSLARIEDKLDRVIERRK